MDIVHICRCTFMQNCAFAHLHKMYIFTLMHIYTEEESYSTPIFTHFASQSRHFLQISKCSISRIMIRTKSCSDICFKIHGRCTFKSNCIGLQITLIHSKYISNSPHIHLKYIWNTFQMLFKYILDTLKQLHLPPNDFKCFPPWRNWSKHQLLGSFCFAEIFPHVMGQIVEQ